MELQLTQRMQDWLKRAAHNRDGWTGENRIGGGTWGALARRGLVGEARHPKGMHNGDRGRGYFITLAGWAWLAQVGIERPADSDRLSVDEALAEAYPAAAAGDLVVCGDGIVRVVIGTTDRKGEPARIVVEGGAEWLASECWLATAEDRQGRQQVRVFYFLRTNGTPWGRQARDYCEGMVALAIEHDLVRTEMVQETVTWLPGEARSTYELVVLWDSRPEEAPAADEQLAPVVLPGDTVEATVAGIGAAQRTMRVTVDREPWPGGFGCTILSDGRGVDAVYTKSIHVIERRGAEHEVIEGTVVQHVGTAEGSLPRDATHPSVAAAREALGNFTPAVLTDQHDVSDPNEDEQRVRGYMIDPREGDRVAVYWLETGRAVRRDEVPGTALDCLADRLRAAGWTVQKMLRSSVCVFAVRPVATRPAPLVVRMAPAREDLDRIRAKADQDRAKFRTDMDARQAAERERYGATDTAAVTR